MGNQKQPSDVPRYWHRVPSGRMAGLVSGIHAYAERGHAMQGLVEAASLDVPVIFNFGSPFRLALGRRPEAGDVHASFVGGLYAGPVIMDSDGGAECVQVNFTPLGARRFFAMPMTELANTLVSLDDLGDRELLRLGTTLEEAKSWEVRLDIVERLVEARLARSHAAAEPVAWAFEALLRSGGQARIGKLAQALDWSRARMVRHFRQEIGLPPKALARIIRFNAAQTLARADLRPDWADIATACGYADQAHLVRDFSVLAGSTPVAWRLAA